MNGESGWSPRACNHYLTTEEVAEICRTSPETVRYWRHVRKGPKSFKVGRRVLYAPEDVEDWLDAARLVARVMQLGEQK